MTNVIIDPPVSPYHPPAEIRKWIGVLEDRIAESKGDVELAGSYRRAIKEAEDWIERQGDTQP